MSVDGSKVTDDIQTGRVVFADTERMKSDTEYAARVQEYVDDGFEIAGSGGESGGGGSALVYEVTLVDNKYRIGGGVTFGDIRRAFESRQTIVLKYDSYYADEDAWTYNRGSSLRASRIPKSFRPSRSCR